MAFPLREGLAFHFLQLPAQFVGDPKHAAFLVIVAMSSIGLPMLNGFVGELLILVGVYLRNPLAAVIATSGVVLAAAYMLWMLQRVALGRARTDAARALTDLNFREMATVIPLAIAVFGIGVYPGPFLEAMDSTVVYVVEQFEQAGLTGTDTQ